MLCQLTSCRRARLPTLWCVPFSLEVGTQSWECHHTLVDSRKVEKTKAIPIVVVSSCYQMLAILFDITTLDRICAYKHRSNRSTDRSWIVLCVRLCTVCIMKSANKVDAWGQPFWILKSVLVRFV